MPFSDIIGHARPLGLLSRSIALGTLPPSLLLTGPAGVGKRYAAVAVAQALNCLAPVREGRFPIDACGCCSPCRRIAKLSHPDFLVLEPGDSGNIKIDPVREALEATAYLPFEARARVVVVDEAERVLPEAQNALLKSLEEPPRATFFALVTSQPETLLPTIRSRCSRVRFGRLTPAEVANLLIGREKMDSSEAHAAAAVAEGSPGRALERRTRGFRAAREAALGALKASAGRSWQDRMRAAAALAPKTGSGERDELATRIRLLATLLRDAALVGQHGGGTALANADLAGEIERIAPAFDAGRATRAFEAADFALAALRRNASPKIVAPWLVVHL
ncbi:MAG TPA: DNA polymerase III subunit [Vicinamibacterales bacterium]|nr:DNA polymerase III subunit [Vicinamibacterales bacterium]